MCPAGVDGRVVGTISMTAGAQPPLMTLTAGHVLRASHPGRVGGERLHLLLVHFLKGIPAAQVQEEKAGPGSNSGHKTTAPRPRPKHTWYFLLSHWTGRRQDSGSAHPCPGLLCSCPCLDAQLRPRSTRVLADLRLARLRAP